jgi:hypothetical protein
MQWDSPPEAIAANMNSSAGATRAASRNEQVQEHQDHLDMLSKTLRTLGVADFAIHGYVAGIIEEYSAELRRSLDPN